MRMWGEVRLDGEHSEHGYLMFCLGVFTRTFWRL